MEGFLIQLKKQLKVGLFVFALAAVLLSGSARVAHAQQAVHLVSNSSPDLIKTAIESALTTANTTFMAAAQQSLLFKEFTLDSIAWAQGKQLLQQLTGDLVKWVNSGFNGEPAFVTNWSEQYASLLDQVTADFIVGEDGNNQCSEPAVFQMKSTLYQKHVNAFQGGEPIQCVPDQYTTPPNEYPLDTIFRLFVEQDGDPINDYLEKDLELSVRRADALANSIKAFDYSKGLKTQQVCTGTGSARTCKYVNPPSVAADSLAYALGELPFQQLLNMDEFNEIVSAFMSNLTNQAMTGAAGLLGLGGNDSYSNNVYGPSGDLSYIDAMAQDDITRYQSYTTNRIQASLDLELEYQQLQRFILNTIIDLEEELARNEDEFPSCFDFELTADLEEIKDISVSNLEISSTTIAVLTVLVEQFADAPDSNTKNAVLTTYNEYEQQGLFRSPSQNQELRYSFIDYEFAEMVDQFKYDTALERLECGGDFNYDGVLTTPEDDE